MRIATKPPEFPQDIWDYVQTILDNEPLTLSLADGARLGRLEALIDMTSSDPSVHRGQLAFIRTGWHYRRALPSLGWTHRFIENQEVFRLEGHDGCPAINLVYFSGLVSDDKQAIESNPRGKRTKIGIRNNQLQYEFNFEDSSDQSSSAAIPDLWLFVVSAWDLHFLDGKWSGRISASLAFCDGALTRTGEAKALGDESKFSRMRCLDYRVLLDHQFGTSQPIPVPPPVKSSPTVVEIFEEGEE